jgi:chloramphenicol 3-O-phosphotransferase
VRCPLAVAEQRERARGDRAPGGARVFHGLVHALVAAHGRYDLELDTAACSPEAGAARILEVLASGPAGTAFRELRQRL